MFFFLHARLYTAVLNNIVKRQMYNITLLSEKIFITIYEDVVFAKIKSKKKSELSLAR